MEGTSLYQCLKLGLLTSPQCWPAQLLEIWSISQSPSLKLGQKRFPLPIGLKRESEAAYVHPGVRIPTDLEELRKEVAFWAVRRVPMETESWMTLMSKCILNPVRQEVGR